MINSNHDLFYIIIFQFIIMIETILFGLLQTLETVCYPALRYCISG